MITSKADYRFYLEADRVALCQTRRGPRPFVDDTWAYQRLLRKVEYYTNCKRSWIFHPYSLFLYFRLHLKGQRLGFLIFPNVFGPGLAIPHRGSIMVSPNAHVGENCRIHVGSQIGSEVRFGDRAPTIGNNVYIGPGAKLFGDLVIGDEVAIGANAVVTRSFEAPHQSIAGVPARKISDKGTEGLLVRATDKLRSKTTPSPARARHPIRS
jgi:serine O-acetyltransferase